MSTIDRFRALERLVLDHASASSGTPASAGEKLFAALRERFDGRRPASGRWDGVGMRVYSRRRDRGDRATAAGALAAGHEVSGMTRSPEHAEALRRPAPSP